MNLKLALIGGLLLAAAAGAALFLTHGRSRHAAHDTTNRHVTASEGAELAMLASMTAPEGKTSCETAFNAVTAEQEAAKKQGTVPRFKWVAAREQFLAGCEALPKDAQTCMMPRYMAQHRDECVRLRPAPDKLKPLFEATQ